jgi:protein TonB
MKQKLIIKKIISAIAILIIALNPVFAQSKIYSQEEVDKKAMFPFGEDSLQKFIYKNIKWTDNHVSGNGSIVICFIVNRNGKISRPKVCKSNFWTSFENEAIRLVKLMPNWNPAQKNSKNVCSKVELPIKFKIED